MIDLGTRALRADQIKIYFLFRPNTNQFCPASNLTLSHPCRNCLADIKTFYLYLVNSIFQLSCCGSESFLDYIGTEFTSNHSTVIATNEIDGDIVTMVVPATCCSSTIDVICTRLRVTGCKEALVNMVIQNSTVIGVLGVSVMFIKVNIQ